jgi:hypothetical protein
MGSVGQSSLPSRPIVKASSVRSMPSSGWAVARTCNDRPGQRLACGALALCASLAAVRVAVRHRVAASARLPIAPLGPTAIGARVGRTPRPGSTLAVARGGAWCRWWRSDSAPTRWTGALPTVEGAISWRPAAPGVDWGELRLAGTGEAWRVRAVVARLDPRRVQLRLDTAFRNGLLGADWTIARAPAGAVLALNAGQFAGSLPWGWTVLNKRELLPPGRGPLSLAVTIDSAGTVHWVPAAEIDAACHTPGIVWAFQSYPMLLEGDGEVPRALRTPLSHGGIDLAHRDARLAIGVLHDGRILIVLTRFDGLDGTLDALPFGLTTPEMAAVMGALGCRTAVMLDGGISGQLLIRDTGGRTYRWPGLRHVPLGLVVLPRSERV